MEVSALKYTGAVGRHGRSPLLRLQSDERLVAYTRRGNQSAFEALVNRYEARLLSFCRHLVSSREDAEDVLQEVFAAAFNALLADDRPINVRPWLYRIARNRSLNHLRRTQAVGVDSMDVHFSDHGASTADKVHNREEFRLLVGDIHELPETQRTALLLREMDALSYEQIAEAMETTVPSVKSLLVRARVSLAEAAQARLLSCDEVRNELGEVAEGLRRRPSPLVRRHLKACDRCSSFRVQLRDTNKALAALLPIGPLVILKKLALAHLGHSASAGSGAGAAGSGASAAGSGATAAVSGATAVGSVAGGGAAGGFISAGLGAVATKAAAGLAAAALVTAGAVEVDHAVTQHAHRNPSTLASAPNGAGLTRPAVPAPPAPRPPKVAAQAKQTPARTSKVVKTSPVSLVATAVAKPKATKPAVIQPAGKTPTATTPPATPPPPPGRISTQTDETVLPAAPTSGPSTSPPPPTNTSPPPTNGGSGTGGSTSPAAPAPGAGGNVGTAGPAPAPGAGGNVGTAGPAPATPAG